MLNHSNKIKFGYYFGFMTGCFVYIFLIVGIIVTKDTRVFWLFISILGAVEFYGTYQMTLGQLFAKEESEKKLSLSYPSYMHSEEGLKISWLDKRTKV